MQMIEPRQRSEKASALIDAAADLANDETPASEVIGYVSMAFYADGSARSAIWRPSPQEHKLGNAIFKAWVQTKLDEHFAYREGVDAACDVLNGDV